MATKEIIQPLTEENYEIMKSYFIEAAGKFTVAKAAAERCGGVSAIRNQDRQHAINQVDAILDAYIDIRAAETA